MIVGNIAGIIAIAHFESRNLFMVLSSSIYKNGLTVEIVYHMEVQSTSTQMFRFPVWDSVKLCVPMCSCA